MKNTQEYFNKTIDELLVTNDHGYTREENLLFDEGLNCTFFDDEKEYQAEKEDFQEWLFNNGMEVKTILKTINERIAVISA